LANVFGHIQYAEDDRWTGPFHVAVLSWDPSKAEQVQLDLGEGIRVWEWDGEK
jgi:hypothetical protein